jgi:hypothetical protein
MRMAIYGAPSSQSNTATASEDVKAANVIKGTIPPSPSPCLTLCLTPIPGATKFQATTLSLAAICAKSTMSDKFRFGKTSRRLTQVKAWVATLLNWV